VLVQIKILVVVELLTLVEAVAAEAAAVLTPIMLMEVRAVLEL